MKKKESEHKEDSNERICWALRKSCKNRISSLCRSGLYDPAMMLCMWCKTDWFIVLNTMRQKFADSLCNLDFCFGAQYVPEAQLGPNFRRFRLLL